MAAHQDPETDLAKMYVEALRAVEARCHSSLANCNAQLANCSAANLTALPVHNSTGGFTNLPVTAEFEMMVFTNSRGDNVIVNWMFTNASALLGVLCILAAVAYFARWLYVHICVLQDTKDRALQEIIDTREQLVDTRKQLVDTEKQLSDTEKQLSDTEKQLSDTEKQLSDTEKQLSLTREALTVTQHEVDITNERLLVLRETTDLAVERHDNMNDKYYDKVTENEDLKWNLKDTKIQNALYFSHLQKLQTALGDAKL